MVIIVFGLLKKLGEKQKGFGRLKNQGERKEGVRMKARRKNERFRLEEN